MIDFAVFCFFPVFLTDCHSVLEGGGGGGGIYYTGGVLYKGDVYKSRDN